MNAEQDDPNDSILQTVCATSVPERARAAAPPAGAWVNLSAEVAATIARDPGDRVKCTWVSGNNYRCNWWAPENTNAYDNPKMTGLTVTTHRVRKSQFLSVTKTADGLVIRDRSRSA